MALIYYGSVVLTFTVRHLSLCGFVALSNLLPATKLLEVIAKSFRNPLNVLSFLCSIRYAEEFSVF